MSEEKILRRGAAHDLWRHTLSRIPTVFGRMVYLTALRDPNTSQYVHHGLSATYSEEEAHTCMRQSHEEAFAEWLGMSLPKQQADLSEYLESIESEKIRVLKTWTKIETYRNLPPDSARSFERELFLTDIETILRLMIRGHGVAWRDQDD